MPIHDWTLSPDGIFHHFHGTWLFEIARELNQGLLPPGYYALGEQVLGGAVPDVLTLERGGQSLLASSELEETSVPMTTPTATMTAIAQDPQYPPRPRVIAIRHVTGDRLVAILEIISPGNKKEAAELGALVEKTVVTLSKGIHVLVIDLYPPGAFDPEGIDNLIWHEMGQETKPFFPERPLQVISYVSAGVIESYIEPRAAGEELPGMPLFLTPRRYVRVPLAKTYQKAIEALPAHLIPAASTTNHRH